MKLLISLLLVSSSAWAQKPNVVMILIDDLSHYGVTAYGANKISSVPLLDFFRDVEFETPRIDSLAQDGVLCENAYAYPLCEPTRIALMSGRNNIRNYHQCKSQHSSDITFGDIFKKQGYQTCMVGKWKQTRGTRAIKGRDYIYQFGWDEFCCFDVELEGRRFIDPNLVINGTIENLTGIDPETTRRYYGPDVINRYALDFIQRSTKSDAPFFLYYPMLLVHDQHTPTPATRPKKLFDDFNTEEKQKCGFWTGDDQRYFPDMITYMDKMIGNVLDQLDESGLRENTIVVVMGDNGTKESFMHILPDGTVFTGDKGGNKEGGLHVPLLLRAPGAIPAMSRYEGLVNLTDILPTLCAATDVEVPNKDNVDGISFWDQVRGKTKKPHREAIYTWYNANYKSHETDNLVEYAFDKEFKRYAPNANYPNGRFFDLRSDPFETQGDHKVAVKNVWNKWHYSGVPLDKLTQEQRRGYERLGEVLETKKYRVVTSIQVGRKEGGLNVGATTQLQYKVLPENASRRGIIWESSDPSIASIDKFGELTAHKVGQVTVTAYSWDDAIPLANLTSADFKKDGIQDEITVSVQH